MTHASEPGERGAVTAELAVTLPAVVLVLAACLGGLGLAAGHVRAQDAAADAARLLARGESTATATEHVGLIAPGGHLTVSRPPDLVCATVRMSHRIMLIPVELAASSCALAGGR